MQQLRAALSRAMVAILCARVVTATVHAAEPDVAQIEEVTVTAQRREESLSKVPISITALSQGALDDLHIESLPDLMGIVPGLTIPHGNTTNNSSPDIGIRGIFSGGNMPTTQLYIDETPIAIRVMRSAGPAGSFFPTIFDLDRVEVLRGPQGTLFGSSAMGGAIRYLTPQPNLVDASGYAKAEVAATDTGAPSYQAGAAYGAPIVPDKVGFRVSGFYQTDGGWTDYASPFTGQVTQRNTNADYAYSARAALTLVPIEGLTITPALFLQRQRSDDKPGYWVKPFLGDEVSGDSPDEFDSDKIFVPSLTIKYQLPGMILQSDTSYLDRAFHTVDDNTWVIELVRGGNILTPGVPPSFIIVKNQIGGTRAWQQQIRLTSANESRFQWVVGGYFRKAHETLMQPIPPNLDPFTLARFGKTSLQQFGVPDYILDGVALNQFNDFNTVDQETAGFGELSMAITPRLKASVGVRVSHSVVKDQQQILAGPLTGVAFSEVNLPDQVENPVTPRATLTYQYTDQDMIYASAAKGYRAGGANSGRADSPNCAPSLGELGLSSAPKTFASDSLKSYEIGAKDLLFHGRLGVQTSVFYIDWSNIQTSISLPSCGQNYTGNRGRAKVKGFELQLEARPIESVKLGGSVGYTDAYYPQAQYGALVNGVPPLLVGAGDKLAVVLPWTAAARAEYSWSLRTLWAGARSYLRADYRWQDGTAKGDPLVTGYNVYLDQFRDQAYSTLNLRLGVVREAVEISAFVDNATGADPLLSFSNVGQRSPTYPLALRTPIRPRTTGLTLSYRF